MERRGNSTLEGWRSNSLELRLESQDLDLVDEVLCLNPELRIVTFLGQQARQRDLAYPVETAEQLVEALANDSFELVGHRVDSRTIVRALADEWFPMAHEGEFLSAAYLALVRCRAEAVAEQRDRLASDTASSTNGG